MESVFALFDKTSNVADFYMKTNKVHFTCDGNIKPHYIST